jgi:hypothetical protein
LPEDVRELRHGGTYPVSYSERLVSLQRSLEAEVDVAAPRVRDRREG